MTQYGVALFYTTSAVMQTEKLLIKKGYLIKLIPTPRQLSSDCGISIRFDWNQQDQIIAVLNEAKIEFNSIHIIEVWPALHQVNAMLINDDLRKRFSDREKTVSLQINAWDTEFGFVFYKGHAVEFIKRSGATICLKPEQ